TRRELAKRARDEALGQAKSTAAALAAIGPPAPLTLGKDFFGGDEGQRKADEFNEKLKKVREEIEKLTGTATPFEAKVAEILRDFDQFKGKESVVRPYAEELARATIAAQEFATNVRLALESMAEPTARNIRLLRNFRESLENLPRT